MTTHEVQGKQEAIELVAFLKQFGAVVMCIKCSVGYLVVEVK